MQDATDYSRLDPIPPDERVEKKKTIVRREKTPEMIELFKLVGRRIAILRHDRGMTQYELADQMGWPSAVGQINRIETEGENMHLSTVCAFAQILRVEPWRLFHTSRILDSSPDIEDEFARSMDLTEEEMQKMIRVLWKANELLVKESRPDSLL